MQRTIVYRLVLLLKRWPAFDAYMQRYHAIAQQQKLDELRGQIDEVYRTGYIIGFATCREMRVLKDGPDA